VECPLPAGKACTSETPARQPARTPAEENEEDPSASLRAEAR